MTNASQEPKISNPSDIISRYGFCVRDNVPLIWKEREYLKPIYDIPFTELFLLKARQVEGSTLLANLMMMYTGTKSFHNTLYITPSLAQTRLFSMITLKDLIRATPYLCNLHYSRPDTVRNVYHKSFVNGSNIFFRYSSAQTVEKIRGVPSVALLTIDEIQDLLIDLLPIIYETQTHVIDKKRILTGTPKSFAHPTEYFWGKSQRIEWVVKCANGHYNILSDKNIDLKGPICSKCKIPIYIEEGRWIRTNPGSNLVGFRLHQMMVPYIKWSDILEKRETYSNTKFLNEVLAMSAESATRGISPTTLQRACKPYHMIQSLDPTWESGFRFGGIDWGLGEISYTIHSIWGVKNGKLHLIYAKRYKGYEADLLIACDDIIKKTAEFKVTYTFADFGFGAGLNEQIAEKFKNFSQIEYTNIKLPLVWDAKGRRYQANRTLSITNFFDDIRKEKIHFPYWNEFEPYGQDILNEYTEYDEKSNVMRYVHNKPDDFMMSAIYAWLAFKRYQSAHS